MIIRLRSIAGLALATAILFGASSPSQASAHVNLLTPAGGESLSSGDVFTITWEIMIVHDTIAWHLEYSTDGSTWMDIQRDLPPATLSYDWTIPDIDCSDCSVRVTMDNSGMDYLASATGISITTGGAGDAGVDTGMGGTDSGAGGTDSGAGGTDSGTGGTDSGTGSEGGGCAVTTFDSSLGPSAALTLCLALLFVRRRRR